MNDIKVILDKIARESAEQSAAIIAAAEENAKKIKADYAEQCSAARAEILKAAEAAADAVELRMASQSGIEQRNLRLETRRAAIDAAFEKAMDKLCAMSDEKKVAFYTELALCAISGPAELVMNAADNAAIGKAVTTLIGKRLITDGIDNVVSAITNLKLPDKSLARVVVMAEQPGNFRGGIYIRQGSIETNCTFEVLLSAAKEELEPEVARLVLG